MPRVPITLNSVVLDSADPPTLGRFYAELTGWPITDQDETWVSVRPGDGRAGISVQLEPLHEPPTWPAEVGAPQMQSHLDLRTVELEPAIVWALECGAVVAPVQPDPENFRVMLDPDGHPFCLLDPNG